MNSDFKDLLRIFNEHKVRYLVVGGYAVIKYTEPRYTKDLDVWVEASLKNARAVFAALREFGAPLTNIAPADFAKEGSVYQIGRPPAQWMFSRPSRVSSSLMHGRDAWPRILMGYRRRSSRVTTFSRTNVPSAALKISSTPTIFSRPRLQLRRPRTRPSPRTANADEKIAEASDSLTIWA